MKTKLRFVETASISLAISLLAFNSQSRVKEDCEELEHSLKILQVAVKGYHDVAMLIIESIEVKKDLNMQDSINELRDVDYDMLLAIGNVLKTWDLSALAV
jgi:hypothetical protein